MVKKQPAEPAPAASEVDGAKPKRQKKPVSKAMASATPLINALKPLLGNSDVQSALLHLLAKEVGVKN